MIRARVAQALCVLVLSTSPAVAEQPPPALTGAVNDFANVLDESGERELERRLGALERATGDVVVVATVPTFQPYADIQEYAVKMFENNGTGIGARGKDNGVLIVVAVKDRKVGIEVGYGLEGFITDGFAGQTIRDAILPRFREQQYGEGLLAGATRIINRIAEGRGVPLAEVPVEEERQPAGRPTGNFSQGLRALLFILFIVFMMSRRSRRRPRRWGGDPWSGWNSGVGPFGGGMGGFGGGFGGSGGGGGGGGGFGGFGGGRSGGGGASGGW